MDDAHLRVGDDERHAAMDRLGEHYRAGRLTADELDERTTSAQRAITRGELAELERDLPDLPAVRPSGAPRPTQTPEAVERRRGRREHVLTYAVVITFLWCIWLVTGAGYPWPIWPMMGWGLGVALHLLNVRDDVRPPLPGPPRRPPLRGERDRGSDRRR